MTWFTYDGGIGHGIATGTNEKDDAGDIREIAENDNKLSRRGGRRCPPVRLF